MRVLIVDDCRTKEMLEAQGFKFQLGDDLKFARSYQEGIESLGKDFLNAETYDMIVLDHDLNSYDESGKEKTGYDFITFLESLYYEGYIQLPNQIVCRSSNPSGRKRIEQVIAKLYEESKK